MVAYERKSTRDFFIFFHFSLDNTYTQVYSLPMTQEQMQALDTVQEILESHFEGAVVSVAADEEDGSTSNHIRIPVGDAFSALGLLEAARHQLLNQGQIIAQPIPQAIPKRGETGRN